jgi:hypothetical protein
MDALDAVRDQWLFCDPPMPPSRRESPPRAVDCGTCRESPPERRAASKQGKRDRTTVSYVWGVSFGTSCVRRKRVTGACAARSREPRGLARHM